jgi:CRP-like cAMP-binding protein
VLIEVGQPGTGLFVLEEGELTVDLPGGREIHLGPGEFVGELALLTDHPRTARVRAATEVRCLAISRMDLTELLDEQPRIAVAMLGTLAARLQDAL